MVTVTFSGVMSLLMTFGPLVLPKAIQMYRSIRSSSQGPHSRVRPVPASAQRALNILWAFAVASMILSLPTFTPENIFRSTQSRLQIQPNVLFSRLQGLRPLTAQDEILKAKFASAESRLLYLQYGPDVLSSCPFCSSDEPSSYYYYALPAILAPHILHLAILGLATSGLIAGSEGARWRTWAIIGGIVFGGLEVWRVGTYDHKWNSTTTRLADIDSFHWNMRAFRYVGFAIIDALFGFAIWLTSTNRWLVIPASLSERLEDNTKVMELMRGKLSMLGAVKNTVMRDRALRERNEVYWTNEALVMGEVSEEREVVEGMNNALGRMDLGVLEGQARGMAESVVGVMNGGITQTVRERGA